MIGTNKKNIGFLSIFNMKFVICITALMCVSLFTACSGFFVNKPKEVVFIDDKSSNLLIIDSDKEIVIDDKMLLEARQNIRKDKQAPISVNQADGSTVSISFDSAGNKSESRCFDNHMRIGCIVVKTSAAGDKSINVLAQNGEMKTLPVDDFANIMSLSADEIAMAAGVIEGRKNDQPQMVFKGNPQKNQSLQPLPSHNFPIKTGNLPIQNEIPVSIEEETGKAVENNVENLSPSESK